MIRRLIILLLIVNCVFGDTKVYNNDFLMFKRTKTLYKVEYVGIDEFKGKPVVKILKASGVFGNQYSFISCDKIIELKSYDGKPIDYDCSNLNNPINTSFLCAIPMRKNTLKTLFFIINFYSL